MFENIPIKSESFKGKSDNGIITINKPTNGWFHLNKISTNHKCKFVIEKCYIDDKNLDVNCDHYKLIIDCFKIYKDGHPFIIHHLGVIESDKDYKTEFISNCTPILVNIPSLELKIIKDLGQNEVNINSNYDNCINPSNVKWEIEFYIELIEN